MSTTLTARPTLGDSFPTNTPKLTLNNPVKALVSDPYLEKILALAHLHALLGSSRAQFNADLEARNIQDDTPTKQLSKDQFDLINKSNVTIQLKGTDSAESDQTIFNETAMLATAVNTRLASVNYAKNPDGYDITKPEDQLRMINDSANGLFNFYNDKMGQFETTKSMSTTQTSNSYSTASIKLDAMVDLFKSLALPEEALTGLLGAVDAFVDTMSKLSASASDKGLRNAKLINFYAVQAPLANPTLANIAKMRMVYVQFNEATSEWSRCCSSGSTYKLDTSTFLLDTELNREVVHLTYDHCKELIVKSAEVSLDEIGASGTQDTTKSVDTGKAQPIGPAPINN